MALSCPALLPAGLSDLLPDAAEREAAAEAVLFGLFREYGFRRVRPPLVEYEETLTGNGPGAKLSADTFRLMDPLSQKMMGVHTDVTTQISRIAGTRMAGGPYPLKLCYAEDVLRMQMIPGRSRRQFRQTGCEAFFPSSLAPSARLGTQVECAVLAVRGLRRLHVPEITLDLTIPGFIFDLLDVFEVKNEKRTAIFNAVDHRDLTSLKGRGAISEWLQTLIQVTGDAGVIRSVLEGLSGQNGFLADRIGYFLKFYDGVMAELTRLEIDNVQVTLDPLEQRGFGYQSGAGFTLFSRASSAELGRGGQYDTGFRTGEEAKSPELLGSGMTFYMDTLVPAAGFALDEDGQFKKEKEEER